MLDRNTDIHTASAFYRWLLRLRLPSSPRLAALVLSQGFLSHLPQLLYLAASGRASQISLVKSNLLDLRATEWHNVIPVW